MIALEEYIQPLCLPIVCDVTVTGAHSSKSLVVIDRPIDLLVSVCHGYHVVCVAAVSVSSHAFLHEVSMLDRHTLAIDMCAYTLSSCLSLSLDICLGLVC